MAGFVHLRTPVGPSRPDCQQFWRSFLKKLTFLLTLILIAAGAASAQNISVDKASLSLAAQTGGSPVSTSLTVSGNAQQAFISTNAPWLRVNGNTSVGAITPFTATITADPAGLPAQTYTSTIVVLSNSGTTINVPVTFSVGSVGVTPASVTFAYQASGTQPAPANLTLTSASSISYSAAATTTTGGAWLTVPASGTSPGTLAVTLNTAVAATLATGTYNGTVTITPASGPALTVAVTLTVTSAPTVTASASTINLNYQIGGATGSTNSASTTITLTNPGIQDLPFGVATSPNGTWLSATPPSGTIPANGSTTVTVSYVIAQNLAASIYTGQVTVFIPNAANQTINIPVNLRVSNSPLLNVPNATLAFTYQLGSATPAARTVVATTSGTAADATTGQMALALTKSDNSAWLIIPSSGFTGTASPISVAVNPAGLAVGSYNATISIIGGGAANNPQTIPVTLTVSNDPMIVATSGGCSTGNTACTLSFPIQTGQAATTTQNVRVTTTTGAQASFSATATMATSAACGTTWLSTGATAAVVGTEATFPITVTPGAIVAGTTCDGTITITGLNATSGAALPNSPVTMAVKMYVSATPMLVSTPIALHFTASPSSNPATQSITVTSTSSTTNLDFNATTPAAAPWLVAFPLARNTAAGTNVVSVLVNPSGLTPGNYTSSITLTATAAGVQNSPVTIPITLSVSTAVMSVTPNTLSFTQVQGSAVPAAKTLTVSTNSTDIPFVTSVTTQQGTGWLSATPATGTATQATPATVTVNVNGSNLPAGTYNGTVTIASPTASGSPVNVAVTFVVQPGTISATPASLTFTQVQGGPAPAAQTVAVAGTPSALAYTVAAAATGGGTWLTATPANGTTNSNVSVSVNGGSLTPGQYTGTVTITSAGASGSPLVVPVTVNVVAAQTITAAPTTLSFSHVIGASTTAAPQTVQLTASATTVPFTATATTATGGSWLSVTPASGTGSAALTVSINPAAITTAGTYTGTVAVTSPNSVTSPAASIAVTLTVTAIPKPVITSVANAASYVSGAVSPGENIVIFGNGIGPATLTLGTVTGNAFPTTVGNTQVFFDNVPAPILYARADQTSVMVPYGVSGRTTTNMRIVYSGVQSDVIPYNVAAATPGIYTANSSGSGQGAILNQDFSVNSSAIPAAKNSVVTIYLTGEGTTSPASVDGRVAPIDGSGLFKPLLPVTATIGGEAVTVEYFGTAPGIVYGVMQVNLRIPANAASGNLPVVVRVGVNATQPNVTVAVQ